MGITFVRTDDRFIHGQVTTGWARKVGTGRIVVVDNSIAANPLIQKLQCLSAGPGIEVIFLTEQQAVDKCASEGFGPESSFLLVGNPVVLLKLVRGGLKLVEVNLGNLRYEPGKLKINNWIFVNEAELTALRELSERGIRLIAQWVVASEAIDVNEWLARHPRLQAS